MIILKDSNFYFFYSIQNESRKYKNLVFNIIIILACVMHKTNICFILLKKHFFLSYPPIFESFNKVF